VGRQRLKITLKRIDINIFKTGLKSILSRIYCEKIHTKKYKKYIKNILTPMD